MPHPDQIYLDAIIHQEYAGLEEIYRKFSGRIKEMVRRQPIRPGAENSQEYTESQAVNVFRFALLSVYNEASRYTITLPGSFEDFFLKRCQAVYETKRPEEERKRQLIEASLDRLPPDCKSVLVLHWNAGPPQEADARNMEALRLRSHCMKLLIDGLDPTFHTPIASI